MKKFVLMLVVAGLGAAGALFAPAQGADVYGCTSTVGESVGAPDPGLGDACAGASQDGTGYVTVDGAEGNEDPLDGFVSVANDGSQDEDGVCASAQGDPGEEFDENGVAIEDDDETPACDDALAGAVAAEVTGAAGL